MATLSLHQNEGPLTVDAVTVPDGEHFFVLHNGDISFILVGYDHAAIANARAIAAALLSAAATLDATLPAPAPVSAPVSEALPDAEPVLDEVEF